MKTGERQFFCMTIKKTITNFLLFFFALIVIASIANAQSPNPHQFGTGYTPQRVYNSNDKRFNDFESMLAELARVDVVFVGEQHNDPATHKLERAILDGLLRRKISVIVALEMFERDVQSPLNDYLAGKISESDFLKVSRPWPNYATDYRPLVEIARAHNWPVIAGNTPRRLASLISRQGMTAISSLPEEDKKYLATQIQCPFDDYFKRFTEAMGSHPGGEDKKDAKKDEKKEAEQRAMIEKFYTAQCVKDETMAESIANSVVQPGQSNSSQGKQLVVHFNGAFHSDYKLGTAARTIRRLPKAKVKVISIVPVDDLDSIKADEYRKRGDYVIFCLKPADAKAESVAR